MLKTNQMRIIVAQSNPIVGNVLANAQHARLVLQQAQIDAADLVVFPLHFLSGSATASLGFDADLKAECQQQQHALKQAFPDIPFILTHIYEDAQDFQHTITIKGLHIAIQAQLIASPFSSTTQADLICVIDASTWHLDQFSQRVNHIQQHITRSSTCPVLYVNQVGGQDKQIYDGASFLINVDGTLLWQAPVLSTHCAQLDIRFAHNQQTVTAQTRFIAPNYPTPLSTLPKPIAHLSTDVPTDEQWGVAPNEADCTAIYAALQLALADFVFKNGFTTVLLGLSGGIDSALVLALAVDALGADRITAVRLPSRYTSDMSNEDAQTQCLTQGVRMKTLAIETVYSASVNTLTPSLVTPQDVTLQNLQARTRGMLLMALSNDSGALLLATSNKSETAMGYSTLYGDMCGGFAPLADCPKTWVYALAAWRNRQSPVIPERVLTRAPSAELKPDQTDQDNLPDYAVIDAVLALYMLKKRSITEIIGAGFKASEVTQVIRLLHQAEFKRRQAALSPSITRCAFGQDWLIPITAYKRGAQ